MGGWVGGGGIGSIAVRFDARSEAANHKLEALSEQKFHNRLKRVYRVDLRHDSGCTTTRYVLAKGVGWGWYGYHAVLAAERLRSLLPALIGYRHGVLFEEWVDEQPLVELDRAQFVERAAEYVAGRSRLLRLADNPVPALTADNRHKATDELSAARARPCWSPTTARARRSSPDTPESRLPSASSNRRTLLRPPVPFIPT